MNKKLIPFPILIMSIAIGVLGVLLAFDLPPMSGHEKMLLKNLIKVLFFAIIIYFVFRSALNKLKQKLGSVSSDFLSDKDSSLPRAEKQVPEGFKREVISDKGFSFCYPASWFVSRPSDPALLKEVREQMTEPGIKGARNFNVSFHDIRRAPNMKVMYQAIIDGVLKVLKGSELEFRQEFESKPLVGMRYKVVYRNVQGLDLCCYQVVITTKKKAKMLIFTFTCQVGDFVRSKSLFDRLSELTEIFE